MGLMDGTYSYRDLVRKYGLLRVPAYKLKVDGATLGGGVGVENLNVSLSLESASAVSFTVAGVYDLEKRAFLPEVKKKLKLGAKVSLELGYGSTLTQVFQGYISNVTYQFSDAPGLSVTAMDARCLMMEGDKRERTLVVTTYSAAFQKVMEDYKALCPKLEVDATDADAITQIVQKSSDYAFITEKLGKEANREFFILNDTAYFREKAKAKSPLLTLVWGEGLISFSRSAAYQNLKITVLGFDPEKKEAVKAQVTEKASDAQTAVGTPHETYILDPDAQEVTKAKNRAEKEAQKRKRKAQQGSVGCVGLPELVPGRFITLKGLDSELDKDYYIKEVHHELGSDGFSTTLEIGGWS
ncbi:MAG: contractile injection system protein, VgrG/Pvc8 family [Oscillospiraceae bacterium]